MNSKKNNTKQMKPISSNDIFFEISILNGTPY